MNSIKKIGKVSIIDKEYVLKEEKDLEYLENYFISRDFHNYLKVLERIDNKNKYQYLEDYSLNNDTKALDIAHTLGLLHNKTSYTKEVTIDKKKEIYDEVLGYINYTEEKYTEILNNIEYKAFPSPSEIIFLNGYSKINDAFMFLKREIDNWYKLVKDKPKDRLAIIHGNMSLEHAICNDKLYLINWSSSRFESPVIDISIFYNNTWDKVDFKEVLEEYLSISTLREDELKLLFITISIPKIIEFSDEELINVRRVRKSIDYIYKTEDLIRPYYTIKNEEENKNLNE